MKPATFVYHAPVSVGECVELLAEFADDAAVLAGGQSLIPLMRFRLAQPAHIVSIRQVCGTVSEIRRTANGIAIGAGVTCAAIQRHADIAQSWPGLVRTIGLVASPAIRTRGTLVGNLCQADPASELPALALIMGAKLTCVSTVGERVIDASDFFLGPYMTARHDDELVSEVEFPDCPVGESFAIKEVARLRGGFPMAGIALSLSNAKDGSITSTAVACFGVHYKQIRLPAAEAALEALGNTPEGIAAAIRAIDHAIEPHSDPFASAAYRRMAVRTLFVQTLAEACSGGAAA